MNEMINEETGEYSDIEYSEAEKLGQGRQNQNAKKHYYNRS